MRPIRCTEHYISGELADPIATHRQNALRFVHYSSYLPNLFRLQIPRPEKIFGASGIAVQWIDVVATTRTGAQTVRIRR
jgi:hypothetical protein